MIRAISLAIYCSIIVGCAGDGPQGPAFDPARSAKEAIGLLDSDGNGEIDSDEVNASPGLKAAFASIDTDESETLSAAEIEERVRYYETAPTAVIQGSTRVTYKGRPLPGARVVFEPESFLGPDFRACEGTTNKDGIASVSRANAEFPGIYLGFYTIRITRDKNGRELLPAKYNEESTIGYEATDDNNANFADIISFDLKK